jgi:hypothetical protein
MAYPPTIPPNNRTNTTPQADNHPSDHNQISRALSDIVNELGSNPSGAQGTVQTRVTNLENNKLNKSGGTMTGILTLDDEEGVGANAAMGRQWIRQNHVNIEGGSTMTGDLLMHGNPGAQAGIRISGDIPIQISETSNTPGQPSIILRRGTSADQNGERFIRFERGDPPGIFMGAIEITSPSSVAIVNASDHRLKVSEGPCQDPAGRIKQLGALAFQGRWIADEGQGQAWDMLYAHDIDPVAPYAVRGAKDAVDTEGNPSYQTVDYSSLVPLLIAALSAAITRIEALEGP